MRLQKELQKVFDKNYVLHGRWAMGSLNKDLLALFERFGEEILYIDPKGEEHHERAELRKELRSKLKELLANHTNKGEA